MHPCTRINTDILTIVTDKSWLDDLVWGFTNVRLQVAPGRSPSAFKKRLTLMIEITFLSACLVQECSLANIAPPTISFSAPVVRLGN